MVATLLASPATAGDDRAVLMGESARLLRAQRTVRNVRASVAVLEHAGQLSYVRSQTIDGHLREALEALEQAQAAITSGRDE